MAKNPREILNDLSKGSVKWSKAHPKVASAFSELGKAALKPKTLDRKTVELIASAISLAVRCDYCIAPHVQQALRAGATRQELIETAGVAIFMGGGPSLTYSATLFLDAIDEFSKDFDK